MLVLLSLLLTYQLWFGQKPLEEMSEDAYEPVFFEEPRPLSRAVTPRWIQLYQGEEIYRFGYGGTPYRTLWDWVSDLMQVIPFAEFRLAEEKPGIGLPLLTLSFGPPLPIGQGSSWLKEGVQREVVEVIIMMNSDSYWMALHTVGGTEVGLDIPRGHGLSLQELVLSLDLNDAVLYRELSAPELNATLGIEISVTEPLFVPAGPILVEELVFKEEELDQELLVKTFFVDRNLVRVIAERDGSLIYTDGEKGLRLSSGLVFSYPQLEQGPATQTYNASLLSAARLLSYYGGWPEQLRMESLNRGKTGSLRNSLVACWRSYYSGFPIFGEWGVVMVFNDSGMVEYKRNLYEVAFPVGSPFIAQGYREALLMALSVLSDKSSSLVEDGAPLTVDDLVFGYAPDPASKQPRGIPVWLIRMNGIDLLINAKDLTWLEGVVP
jgi:regulatory protein YycH of two-component signal transduction system YycFG